MARQFCLESYTKCYAELIDPKIKIEKSVVQVWKYVNLDNILSKMIFIINPSFLTY